MILTLDKPVIAQTSNFELLANDKRVAKASAVYTDADYRTLHISFNKKLTDDKLYAVRINGLTDWQQNVTRTTSPTFYFAPDSILIKLETPVSLYEQVRLGSENHSKAQATSASTSHYQPLNPTFSSQTIFCLQHRRTARKALLQSGQELIIHFLTCHQRYPPPPYRLSP